MLDITFHDGWTQIRIPPTASLGDMVAALEAAPSQQGKTLLIDASAMVSLSDATAHALLGEHMSARLARARKVAVLVPEEVLSYNSERVAQSRRLNLRVFTSRAEAEAWIAA